jgi:hypothetical protein
MYYVSLSRIGKKCHWPQWFIMCSLKSFLIFKGIHRKKKVREFPVPSRDVTTKLSLGGNNDVITELFLLRGSLVSDIPAGDGKTREPFFTVYARK